MTLPDIRFLLDDQSVVEVPVLRVLRSEEPLWVAFHLATIGRPFIIFTQDRMWRGSMKDDDVEWLRTAEPGDRRFSDNGDFEILSEAEAVEWIQRFNSGNYVSP